jgi:AbrB family looped-hinge helix DNA binding protein
MPSATVTSKGQVTIPKAIRRALRLAEGDRLDFVVEKEGRVVVRAGAADISDLKGLLHRPCRRAPGPVVEMIGLDTNVLVRYLTQDEPGQAKKANALIAAAEAKREKLHLDVVVLCELVWVLRGAYDLDKDTVCAALDKILAAAQFSIDDRDRVREALSQYRAEGADFADYLLGSRNRGAGCSATVTFDRALKGSALFHLL